MGATGLGRLAIHQQLTEGSHSRRSTWRKAGGLAPAGAPGSEFSRAAGRRDAGRLPVEMARGAWLREQAHSWFTKASWCSGVAPPLRGVKGNCGQDPPVPGQQARGFLGRSRPMVSTRASWRLARCCLALGEELLVEGLGWGLSGTGKNQPPELL